MEKDKDPHNLTIVPTNALTDELLARFTDYIFMGFVDAGENRINSSSERYGGCAYRCLGMCHVLTRVITAEIEAERSRTEIEPDAGTE